jgi:hypothetical protein
MIMSNRSYISTYYEWEDPDGTIYIVESDKGNEELLEEHRDSIGKDVVCSLPIGYSRFRQNEGGVEITIVALFNLNGSVPNFMMNWAMAQNVNAPTQLQDWLVDRKKPALW